MRQLYSFYFDAFWIAIKSILEHKLRAFLTLIGIIIGVAAVVVVGASISGLKTYVVETASKVLGSNVDIGGARSELRDHGEGPFQPGSYYLVLCSMPWNAR